MEKQQQDSFRSWVLWYNNCTPITARLYCPPSRKMKVKFSNTVIEDFCISLLRDKRDWSTLNWKLSGGKPQTQFQHMIHNFLRSHGYIGTLSGTRIKDSLPMVINIAMKLWKDLDTDLCKTLIELAEEGSPESWQMIAKAKVNPNSAIYQGNSDLFLRDYQAVNFLRKYEGLTALCQADPNRAALKAWLAAERQCKDTNEIFMMDDMFNVAQLQQLYAVKQCIQKILGPSPSIAQVRENLRIGPGATRSCPSKFCSIFDKIDSFKTTSRQAYATSDVMLHDTFWRKHDLVVSNCSTLAFVGKTALVSRTIEPPEDFDSQVQMALGSLIKTRLKKFGLDINCQASCNALLAEQSSQDGLLATIDLSSASDTIAYRVIELLLPKGWFNWLSRYRTQIVKISDPSGVDPEPVHYRLNKFSAMGNGFTFELETLLFLAITLVGCNLHHEKTKPQYIGVFGDDIICPTTHASRVIELLNLCGFSVNTDKTFISGFFRESCGADFFFGAPVRPFFLKKEIVDVTQLYNLANGIRRVSVRSLNYYGSDVRYRDVWQYIVSYIPKEYRFGGTSEYGDEIIWASPDDDNDIQFAVSCEGIWKGKRLAGIQRGVNLYAYKPDTPISAWLMTKERGSPTEYRKRIPDIGRLSQYKLAGLLSEAVRERESMGSTVLQRTFRAHHTYYTRYRLSNSNLTLKADCPRFI